MALQIEVEDEEDSAVVKVMVTKEAEEGIMGTINPMSKATQRMAFNVTIAIDSGCSNHMKGTKSIFRELDEKQRKKVELGNTKEMQVEGKGKVIVDTSLDKVKVLDNV
ncbi:hypothetical protein BC332_14862 [Capsicum chinense]|nr:hypothetical protein BC332_14862 [Capsicum chinense]